MKLFDLHNNLGEKIGEVHDSYVGGGPSIGDIFRSIFVLLLGSVVVAGFNALPLATSILSGTYVATVESSPWKECLFSSGILGTVFFGVFFFSLKWLIPIMTSIIATSIFLLEQFGGSIFGLIGRILGWIWTGILAVGGFIPSLIVDFVDIHITDDAWMDSFIITGVFALICAFLFRLFVVGDFFDID